MNDSAQIDGCDISLDDSGQLRAENGQIERRWHIDPAGCLAATSIVDKKEGTQWLCASPVQEDDGSARTLKLDRLPPVDGFARAILTVARHGKNRRYEIAVSSTNPAIILRMAASPPAPRGPAGSPEQIELLAFAPIHLVLRQIRFEDATDRHNELVDASEWLLHPSQRPLRLAGCLFIVEDLLTKQGLILLKMAPLPGARPAKSNSDLLVHCAARRLELMGHAASDDAFGYGWTILPYAHGAAGASAALHAFQRSLNPYRPGRDGQLLSNTWGDRNRDGRISAEFIDREIAAARRLGVDVVQIDDGWQQGVTSNSVEAAAQDARWEGFNAAPRDFWAVHQDRFPQGFEPIAKRARANGVRLGLWFAPDSADDFANWALDGDRVLALHTKFGVDHFKIDAVKLRSVQGERNLTAFYKRVREGSGGSIALDLDITAEMRPGYWGMIEGGPLFVENRYTDTHRYWPHATLRNLWSLAHFIDPLRLRMEWLNPLRNANLYADDPLAPETYPIDYLFATILFASPLAWFEISGLAEAQVTQVASLIALWKVHRDALYAGTSLPIGDRPDGTSWTGFVSLGPDERSAYVMILREHNGTSTRVLPLPLIDVTPAATCTVLAGTGTIKGVAGGVEASIPEPRRYLFVKIALA